MALGAAHEIAFSVDRRSIKSDSEKKENMNVIQIIGRCI